MRLLTGISAAIGQARLVKRGLFSVVPCPEVKANSRRVKDNVQFIYNIVVHFYHQVDVVGDELSVAEAGVETHLFGGGQLC